MQTYRKDAQKDLGKRLKELRMKKGLSPTELEKAKILTRCTISRVENGKINPKFSTLVNYSIALDMSLIEILNGIEYIKNVADNLEREQYE